jgi:16S rRNA C967 or C1407 C5-methylase (RsmB/RsmF family)
MNIIDLLSQRFSKPKNTTSKKSTSRHTRSEHHYYTEITRYFNQIQFIINKTKRSLSESSNLEIAYYLYITYRYFWEKSKFKDIRVDFKQNLSLEEEKELLSFYNRLMTWNWDISLQNKQKIEKLSIRYAAPTFFIQRLLPVLEYEQIQQNIVAMDQRSREGANYLRINATTRSNNEILDKKDFFIEYFKKKGVNFEPVEDFPFLLQSKVQDKDKIVTDLYYRQNQLTFQEKASVASVCLLNPQPGEIIVDLCAAPGTKLSLISQIVTGDSTIIAGDFHEQRIGDMVSFLSSLDVKNVHTIQWDGINPPLREETVDRILLDAPCTGSGTFTSNPELKWRQSDKFLERNVILQQGLLKSALKALKVGGTLVYSTCSLYPEEGEYQIQNIVGNHVIPAPTPSWLPPSYKIKDSYIEGAGRFFPADHGTIGFFVAKLIKKNW